MYLKGWVILQMDNRNTCSLRCCLILNIIHLSEGTVYFKFSQPFSITLIEISVLISQVLRYPRYLDISNSICPVFTLCIASH